MQKKSSWTDRMNALMKKRKWDVKDLHRALNVSQWMLEKLLSSDTSEMDPDMLEKLYQKAQDSKLDKKMFRFECPIMIAFWAHKGGTGKSTTATNLSYELGQLGYNVLAIDTDSQSDMTSVLYPEYLDNPEKSFYEAFNYCDDFVEGGYVFHTEYLNVDVICGSAKCESLESSLAVREEKHRDGIWARCLREIRKQNYYDFIIVDMDKTAGFMNISILKESDYVITPIEPAMFAAKAVPPIITQVEFVAQDNAKPKLLGMFFNRVDLRKKKTFYEVMGMVETLVPGKTFNTYIKSDASVENSQMEHMPLGYYSRSSDASKQMVEFTKEMLERIRKDRGYR